MQQKGGLRVDGTIPKRWYSHLKSSWGLCHLLWNDRLKNKEETHCPLSPAAGLLQRLEEPLAQVLRGTRLRQALGQFLAGEPGRSTEKPNLGMIRQSQLEESQ